MGAIPNRILVHTATPLNYLEVDDAPFIEGEPGDAGVVPTYGTPFACVLFLPAPGGTASDAYRPRVVRNPTLLFNPIRDYARAPIPADGTPIVITNETELMVDAPELAAWTGGSPARWQVNGDAQAIGPPGQVYVIQAQLGMVQG